MKLFLLGLCISALPLAARADYIDEGQCFGGQVPNATVGVSVTKTVSAARGTYVATLWRQECAGNASAALLLKLQAVNGTPSESEFFVSQSGLIYDGLGLVKDPLATLLINYQLIGSFSTVTTIVKQYGGARYDALGKLSLILVDSAQGTVTLDLPASPSAQASASVSTFHGNYTDMWWNAAENGTGLSIIQHGSNQLFIVWYTYADTGEPLWLVWPGGSWTDQRTFSGGLYKTRGTTFSEVWNPSAFVVGAPYGTAQIRFDQADKATMTFTVGGKSGTKSFTRQSY